MTDGEYQATFFIRKKKKKKKKTHKSWDISSLHLFGINFLFFDFVEVEGLIGNGTAATESGEDHLQPMHLSRRHAFCRPNPSRDPFWIPLNSPKLRPWSFPLPIINAAVHLWAGLPLQRQHKADLSLEGSDACSTADSCPETLCFKARGSD